MKAIAIALLALTVGVSGVFAAGPLGDDSSTDRTIPLSTVSSSSSTTTETGEDVPGPCDEPEHANDPRCGGGTTAGTTTAGTTTAGTTTVGTTSTTETRGRDAREPGEDVRGPCDEAEHANDPRCAGAAAGGDDDRRGRNSGPGGGEDSGSGSSGRSGSDDSGDDSGSGSSGDDDRSDSNSGSG